MHILLKQTTALALVLGLAVPGAQAQSVEQNPADEEVSILDRITVTARRTEEDIQDVPGSVIVIGDEELEQGNLDDGTDIFRRLPNVSFTEAGSPVDTDISIRGISSLIGGNSASGPTVGVFFDGALVNPTGQGTGINPNLIDVERVETIFGPQGTAFGRGTIGGAINFISKKPTDNFEGSIETEFSSFTDIDSLDVIGKFVLNTPILEDGLLSARLVGYGRESEGFIQLLNNPDPDVDSSEISEGGVRLSLRSRPTEQITLDASASFDRSEFVTPNSVSALSFAADNPVNVENFFGDDDVFEQELYTFNGNFELTDGVLKSNTSYIENRFESSGDTDGTAFDLLEGFSDSGLESFSQEFRFESRQFDLGESRGEVAFNVGVFASDADFEFESILDPSLGLADPVLGLDALIPPGFIPPPFAGIPLNMLPPDVLNTLLGSSKFNLEQEVTTFSLYGDVRWQPIDPLEIVVGARYTRDTVTASSQTVSVGAIALPIFFPSIAFISEEETFNQITPNASINYKWNDNFSTYFSYSTGFRAGGFNQTFFGSDPFDEETAQSFEVGFKSSLFDESLIINLSAFYIDYEDIQLVIPSATGLTAPITDNFGSVRSVGGELGITYIPMEGLTIDTQLGLAFAEFQDTVSNIDPITMMPVTLAVPGQTLPNAPETTLSVVAEYEHPEPILFNAQPFIRGEYTYTSEFSNILTAGIIEPFDGFDLFNLRVGLRGETFEVSAFAENLFDEIYATGTTSLGAAGFIGGLPGVDTSPNLDIGERRRVGVIGKFKF